MMGSTLMTVMRSITFVYTYNLSSLLGVFLDWRTFGMSAGSRTVEFARARGCELSAGKCTVLFRRTWRACTGNVFTDTLLFK
jgi:hypothetical protein